jgi:hypothetical protein
VFSFFFSLVPLLGVFLLFINYINVSIIFFSHTSRSKLGVRSSHLFEERYSWIQRCLPNRQGDF